MWECERRSRGFLRGNACAPSALYPLTFPTHSLAPDAHLQPCAFLDHTNTVCPMKQPNPDHLIAHVRVLLWTTALLITGLLYLFGG